jgi:ribosome maturation factor RimP
VYCRLAKSAAAEKRSAMTKSEIEKKTEEYILPILDELHFILWDVEFVKEGGEYFLRAYIDKEGGISLDDCTEVSRRMNDILDSDEYIDVPYTFEVSSPGLTRVLKKDRELQNSIGRDVDVTTYQKIDGAKEFTGILKSFDKDHVLLSFGDSEMNFDRKNISKIRLSPDF